MSAPRLDFSVKNRELSSDYDCIIITDMSNAIIAQANQMLNAIFVNVTKAEAAFLRLGFTDSFLDHCTALMILSTGINKMRYHFVHSSTVTISLVSFVLFFSFIIRSPDIITL